MKENREENDLLQAALIVLMQFVIVPLTTLKTIFVVKGRTTLGAILGGIGALIYVISLGMVFADLSNYINMIAYALGNAGGTIIGGRLEEKLAIGYRIVMVSLMEKNNDLIEMLRDEGFGVTVFVGEGRNGAKRYRLDILVKRNRVQELLDILERKVPKAFVVAYEPTNFKGGYLVKSMKRKRRFLHHHITF